MAWIDDTLLELSKQLYPQGRAFKMPPGGTFEDLTIALNKSKGQAYTDAISILNDIIPDNAAFGTDDATDWERRLAIIGNSLIPLANRKAAILQKMAYPGTDAPRCAASYLTAQLQLAGFNVKVYENRFYTGSPASWVTMTPEEILGADVGDASYNLFGYGELGYGDTFALSGVTKVVNYIEEAKDEIFVISPNYRSTFFIADPSNITTFATVLLTQKAQFRQLILQLKPAQTVGFLFVNYV